MTAFQIAIYSCRCSYVGYAVKVSKGLGCLFFLRLYFRQEKITQIMQKAEIFIQMSPSSKKAKAEGQLVILLGQSSCMLHEHLINKCF